ncbi:MAG: hypothetical protein O7B26_00995, partial [Planctomycetota bacterium]|nr:hypothetical protein [Planctomycetota bacterium]
VAVASLKPGESGGPFQSVADLVHLNESKMHDALSGGNNSAFRIDRYEDDGTISLDHHRVNTKWPAVGVDNPFSPDFRVRGNRDTTDGLKPLIEYVPMKFDTTPTPEFGAGGLRGRDVLLSRWANLLTTRSDVFTAYIALIDENGRYVQRSEVTFDRSGCFREERFFGQPNFPILPDIVLRSDSTYYDDTQ